MTGVEGSIHQNKLYKISVVSPVYQSATLVIPLVEQVVVELKKITPHYELILVEDRSEDQSWYEIKKACEKYSNVIGVRLSRNFGQHYAISAGLSRASGDWIVVMDCDLQDQPSEISKLFDEAMKGYDVVLARRALRNDKFLKRMFSRFFYSILTYLTGVKHDATIANFGIYNKKVIDAVNSMPESIKYFPTMVGWVGFNASKIDVAHSKRADGETSYSLKKLFNLAVDICLANSDKPIKLAIQAGFFVFLTGFIFACYVAYLAVLGEVKVVGYASLLVSIWILSGMMIFIIGVVGLYVGKSFEGIKKRPAFIIDEIVNEKQG